MILVTDTPDQIIKKFIEQHIPRCREYGLPDDGQSLGVFDEKAGHLVGGFYYHNWDPKAGVIEMSGASIRPRWFTRSILVSLFAYPFLGLGCQMVFMHHSVKDTQLAARLKQYGSSQHLIPRRYGRDEDGLISTLTIEDWKKHPFHKDR